MGIIYQGGSGGRGFVLPHGQESERCEGYFEIGDLGIQEQGGGGGILFYGIFS